MLFLGHDREAGVHAAHELGSFNLALAIAFAVGAIRPKLSAGLAWPCAIAAGGLVTTAIIDLIGGQAIGADEAQHLVALAGAALLVWQSVTSQERIGGARDRARRRPGGNAGRPRRGTPGPRLDGAPDRPWGGDAARVAGPGVAAAASGRPMPRQPRPPALRPGRPTPTCGRATRPSRDADGTDHQPGGLWARLTRRPPRHPRGTSSSRSRA